MIIKQEWRSYIKTLIVWAVCVAGFCFTMLLLYPQLQDSMKEMEGAIKGMGAFGTAFGMDQLSLGRPIGFYGAYVGAILAVGGALFAAMLGTGVLAKEEEGHTAEFLYTLPYSRTYVVIHKIIAVMSIILVFDIVSLFFGWLGLVLIGADFSLKTILIFHLGQLLMHCEIAAICILISACNKKVNMGVGLGLALLFYFMDMMARVLESIKWFRFITPYYYANATDVLINKEIDPGLLALGMIIGGCALVAGTYYYAKKDLAA